MISESPDLYMESFRGSRNGFRRHPENPGFYLWKKVVKDRHEMTTPSGPHGAHMGRHRAMAGPRPNWKGGNPSLLPPSGRREGFLLLGRPLLPPPPIYMCGGLPLETHQSKGDLSRIAPRSPGLIGLSV